LLLALRDHSRSELPPSSSSQAPFALPLSKKQARSQQNPFNKSAGCIGIGKQASLLEENDVQ
jgi:hypothetical protein